MDTLTALSGSPTQPMGAYPGPTRLLIDGKWVDAASGKTFETRNPATGELLANVAEGDAEDHPQEHRAEREAERGARAVDEAGKEIASLGVGAERVPIGPGAGVR